MSNKVPPKAEPIDLEAMITEIAAMVKKQLPSSANVALIVDVAKEVFDPLTDQYHEGYLVKAWQDDDGNYHPAINVAFDAGAVVIEPLNAPL